MKYFYHNIINFSILFSYISLPGAVYLTNHKTRPRYPYISYDGLVLRPR